MTTAQTITVDIGAALAALQASPELGAAMNEAMGLGDRYFLSRDSDCHWYVIPVARQQEWEEWCAIDPDDERAWTPPAFARVVGGSPSTVTFCAPEFAQ
jgi:hypothetical protein